MPSDGGATTDELFIVICPSERHNPPGPWRSAPVSYADARRLDLQHGMDWGLGHEDTRIETYEAENPPPLPVPPAPPPSPSRVDPQIGIQPQYDLTSKTFTGVLSATLVLNDVTWVESRDQLLSLLDQPGVNVQVDNTGQVQLVLQVDVIKRSLRDICESCHSSLLRAAEVHLQLQEGAAVGGGHHLSRLENAELFLSTRKGRLEFQIGANIQSLGGEVHGQVFGTVVFHFGRN